jgi:hypothetical protein
MDADIARTLNKMTNGGSSGNISRFIGHFDTELVLIYGLFMTGPQHLLYFI